MQQSVFSGNEPELLDSFSQGAFYSDESITVWNDDEAAYETTKSLSEGDEAEAWLFGDDAFLTKMRQVGPHKEFHMNAFTFITTLTASMSTLGIRLRSFAPLQSNDSKFASIQDGNTVH